MKKINSEKYMARAIELAKKARGLTSPNPLVGCVIVKNNRIIAEGYHEMAGKPHAEAQALKKAGVRAQGADLYVNLEPCSHYGKTPPCTDKIIKAGIKKVYAGMTDPNPVVKGKGFKKLSAAGIRVKNGIMNTEAGELNSVFIKNINKKLPYVVIKAGMSIDGKIALKNRKSKWITSEKSRNHAQQLRKNLDAILVGINTVLIDDPYLDCRICSNKKIKKIVLDTKGRIPLNAKVFKHSDKGDVFIFTVSMKNSKIKALENKGVSVIKFTKSITPKAVLKKLYTNGITGVLIEGGSAVATSFIKAGCVDEAYFYVAPKIIGADGLSFFGEMGFKDMRKIFSLENTDIIKIGNDILIKGKVRYV